MQNGSDDVVNVDEEPEHCAAVPPLSSSNREERRNAVQLDAGHSFSTSNSRNSGSNLSITNDASRYAFDGDQECIRSTNRWHHGRIPFRSVLQPPPSKGTRARENDHVDLTGTTTVLDVELFDRKEQASPKNGDSRTGETGCGRDTNGRTFSSSNRAFVSGNMANCGTERGAHSLSNKVDWSRQSYRGNHGHHAGRWRQHSSDERFAHGNDELLEVPQPADLKDGKFLTRTHQATPAIELNSGRMTAFQSVQAENDAQPASPRTLRAQSSPKRMHNSPYTAVSPRDVPDGPSFVRIDETDSRDASPFHKRHASDCWTRVPERDCRQELDKSDGVGVQGFSASEFGLSRFHRRRPGAERYQGHGEHDCNTFNGSREDKNVCDFNEVVEKTLERKEAADQIIRRTDNMYSQPARDTDVFHRQSNYDMLRKVNRPAFQLPIGDSQIVDLADCSPRPSQYSPKTISASALGRATGVRAGYLTSRTHQARTFTEPNVREQYSKRHENALPPPSDNKSVLDAGEDHPEQQRDVSMEDMLESVRCSSGRFLSDRDPDGTVGKSRHHGSGREDTDFVINSNEAISGRQIARNTSSSGTHPNIGRAFGVARRGRKRLRSSSFGSYTGRNRSQAPTFDSISSHRSKNHFEPPALRSRQSRPRSEAVAVYDVDKTATAFSGERDSADSNLVSESELQKNTDIEHGHHMIAYDEGMVISRIRRFANLAAILRTLNLDFCGLKTQHLAEFPSSVAGFPELHDLSLEYNVLESVPAKFAGCLDAPSLRSLSLKANMLTDVPSFITSCSSLRLLNLSHNKLTAIPEAIFELEFLECLELSHNMLHDVPVSGIGKMKRLEVLKLNHNRLRSMACDIGLDNDALVALDVSNNIEFEGEFPETFAKLSEQLLDLCLEETKLIKSLPRKCTRLSPAELCGLLAGATQDEIRERLAASSGKSPRISRGTEKAHDENTRRDEAEKCADGNDEPPESRLTKVDGHRVQILDVCDGILSSGSASEKDEEEDTLPETTENDLIACALRDQPAGQCISAKPTDF